MEPVVFGELMGATWEAASLDERIAGLMSRLIGCGDRLAIACTAQCGAERRDEFIHERRDEFLYVMDQLQAEVQRVRREMYPLDGITHDTPEVISPAAILYYWAVFMRCAARADWVGELPHPPVRMAYVAIATIEFMLHRLRDAAILSAAPAVGR